MKSITVHAIMQNSKNNDISNILDIIHLEWTPRILRYLQPTSGKMYIMQSKLYMLLGNNKKANDCLVNGHKLIIVDEELYKLARQCRLDFKKSYTKHFR